MENTGGLAWKQEASWTRESRRQWP